MTPAPRVVRACVTTVLLSAVIMLFACDSTGPILAPGSAEPVGFSAAYDIWRPGEGDTCTPEIHNQFSTVGPDRLLYPTWHPPVDPASGCSFGHDHGRDPSGSDLFGEVGPLAFAYANEQLAIWDPTLIRNEDHYGHKVEWENDFEMDLGDDVVETYFSVKCDLLTKLHQGTHSKDAFTNNLHELIYHIKCTDGTEFHLQVVAAIGDAGGFTSSCNREQRIEVGPPVPANSPDGGGHRIIPERSCIDQMFVLGEERSNFGLIRESWEVNVSLRTADGHRLVSINPYYQVLEPSRFYDPTMPDFTGRPLEACFEIGPNGERIQGGPCEESVGAGLVAGALYYDPRSAFDGAHRFVDINSNTVSNENGPKVWYTDPFGRNGSTEPFPGSIRQFVAAMSNDRGLGTGGPNIGRDRDYGGNGVHSPN